MGKYAKAIVAVLGSALTASLGLVAPHTTAWTILTILAAALSAYGVFAVPNAGPTPPAGINVGTYVGK